MKNGARSSIADIFKALSMVKEVPELRKKEPDEMCVPPSGEQQKRVTMEGDPNPPSGVTKDLVTQDLPSLWLWASVLSEAESGRQHGAEVRSIPGWLTTDPFSGVAGLLNRWAAPVLWEALDEKVTPLLVEDAVESVKPRGAKLELKAAGQVGRLFLSALCTVYRKTLTQNADIRKLRDEVAALQERQLLMKETIESAVTRGDQMETRCTALAV
ncbi:hypothetical protein NDU88_011632 [Pleurodeles waltl]|uniref:Uncharacterized protein n=1 Tax=Pleurodeles waltl TaxID=8319 RepID=A0AAV7S6S0_PLEWA|nr:hypothetical protein NDU88_011632 [Pleurodeles waltl]